VCDELRREGIPLEVRCGGELGHDMVGRLHQHELELIAQGPAGARWLLVEAPFTAMTEAFQDAVDELRDRGFGVLIAHPERSGDAELEDSVGLRMALARGAMGQANALSFTGGYGEEARRSAQRIVAESLIAVVASDAHGPTRPPALTAARDALVAGGVDDRRPLALTQLAARHLLRRGLPARSPEASAAGLPA